jgi:hypothetical protein
MLSKDPLSRCSALLWGERQSVLYISPDRLNEPVIIGPVEEDRRNLVLPDSAGCLDPMISIDHYSVMTPHHYGRPPIHHLL